MRKENKTRNTYYFNYLENSRSPLKIIKFSHSLFCHCSVRAKLFKKKTPTYPACRTNCMQDNIRAPVSQNYRELLQPYSHDHFSKISRTLCACRNQCIIIVFLQRTLKEKLPIFLINTFLLHIPLLAFTDRQNYRRRNKTLAAHGLEELIFQLCCCVSFWFWLEIDFGSTYLCTQSTIQLWCCVSFFGSGGKQFLVLRTYLVYNTVVRLCQFFGCGEKQFSKLEHVSTTKNLLGYFIMIRQLMCVYFTRPNTLLLYIFLFCIFLLYCADSQVEVQIKILLKDKYGKSCQ